MNLLNRFDVLLYLLSFYYHVSFIIMFINILLSYAHINLVLPAPLCHSGLGVGAICLLCGLHLHSLSGQLVSHLCEVGYRYLTQARKVDA